MTDSSDARIRIPPGPVLVLALAILGLAACTSGRPESTGPLVTRKVEPDPPALTRSRIGQAEALEQVGDYEGALALLRQALAGAGDNTLRARIQEARVRLKRQALDQVLVATVSVGRDRVVAGDAIFLTVTLANRGDVEIVIPKVDYRRRLILFRKEMGRSVIDLEFRLDEFDARGSHRAERFHEFVEPVEDIRVSPGSEWAQVCRIDLEAVQPQTEFTARLTAGCLKRLQVGGVIRPVQLLVGDQDLFTTIRLRGPTLYVLPRGSEAMYDSPLRHLELAIRRAPSEPRFLPHVLVASSLLEGEDRERGREALLRCRDRGAAVLRPSVERALELFWPESRPEPEAAKPGVTFK